MPKHESKLGVTVNHVLVSLSLPFLSLSLSLSIYIYFFSFPYYLHFSGIQENEPESIDFSDLTNVQERADLRYVFLRVGFADDSAGKYKLRPCPLGTFVDSSHSDPRCKNCSAGKLDSFFFSLEKM